MNKPSPPRDRPRARDWLELVLLVLLGTVLAIGLGVLVAIAQGRAAFAGTDSSPACDLTLRTIASPPFRVRARDLEDLARTIFAESRGESLCGQIAVGYVAANRLEVDPATWGGSLSAVVRKPRQFSPWTGAAATKRLEALDELSPGYLSAHLAAGLVLTGAIADPTSGATYFHARSMVPPRWTRNMVRTARIGAHVFYKGKG